MKGALAAILQWLVLPWGAVSGRRIVLDGTTGEIAVYGADDNLDILISSLQEAIQLYVGTELRIALDASDGSIRTFSATPGNGTIIQDDNIRAYSFLGSYVQLEGQFAAEAAVSFRPPDNGVIDWVTGHIWGSSSGAGVNAAGQLWIQPPWDPAVGTTPTFLLQSGTDAGAADRAQITADEITLFGDSITLTSPIDFYDNNLFNTYTPVVTGGGTVTWTTRTGRWQRIGGMIFFMAYLNVNAPGSGAATITISAPVNIDRTVRQIVTCHLDNITAAREGTGVALAFDSGSGAQFDRIRGRDNVNITGADLLAAAHITITGWIREA